MHFTHLESKRCSFRTVLRDVDLLDHLKVVRELTMDMEDATEAVEVLRDFLSKPNSNPQTLKVNVAVLELF